MLDPAQKARSLAEEFKAFALKGNVVDLAVGVVIGTAFGNIVKSLVDNIIMPTVGLLTPADKGFEGWRLEYGGAVIPFGLFLGAVVNFLIVALALFLFIKKFLAWILRTKATAPPLTKDQQLLTEIRDLLQARGPADRPA
jgi:large conductance mechanosensitive channel